MIKSNRKKSIIEVALESIYSICQTVNKMIMNGIIFTITFIVVYGYFGIDPATIDIDNFELNIGIALEYFKPVIICGIFIYIFRVMYRNLIEKSSSLFAGFIPKISVALDLSESNNDIRNDIELSDKEKSQLILFNNTNKYFSIIIIALLPLILVLNIIMSGLLIYILAIGFQEIKVLSIFIIFFLFYFLGCWLFSFMQKNQSGGPLKIIILKIWYLLILSFYVSFVAYAII